jgi:multisubunit Na+/H+ antiporter MnhF subunit
VRDSVYTLVTLILLLLGVVGTIGFITYARPTSWFAFLFFFAWTLPPYVAVAGAVRCRPSNRASRFILCVIATLLSSVSILTYFYYFVLNPDPQNGLLLLSLPPLQLFILVPFILYSRYLAKRPVA